MAKQEQKDEDEGVYSEEDREEQLEDDELSADEECFMKGYDEADKEAKESEEEPEE